MDLAVGYVALAMQTHDELVSDQANERRRIVAERRVEAGDRADHRSPTGHRFAEWRHGRRNERIHGLPVAH